MPFDYTDDGGNGANDGKFQANDTLTVSFTEPLAAYSTSGTAQLKGGATASTNDEVSLPGTLGAAFTSLNSVGYITGAVTANFASTTAARAASPNSPDHHYAGQLHVG